MEEKEFEFEQKIRYTNNRVKLLKSEKELEKYRIYCLRKTNYNLESFLATFDALFC